MIRKLLVCGLLAMVSFGSAAQEGGAAREGGAAAGRSSDVSDALAAGSAAVAAEEGSLPEPGIESEVSADSDLVMPARPNDIVLSDPATRQSYLDAMQRYYDYRKDGYEFRSRVFEWQLLSTRIIFVVVVLLVVAGIYFAAVQFHVALATIRNVPAQLESKLEVSAKGIVVNSSVLGVVILGLSLAFFYLYLVHIYPIRDVL